MNFCLLSSLYLFCNINIDKLQGTGKMVRKILSLKEYCEVIKHILWFNAAQIVGYFQIFGLPIHNFLCHSQLNYYSWL
jgi:hypothetical protein